jgi:hypothetical protein
MNAELESFFPFDDDDDEELLLLPFATKPAKKKIKGFLNRKLKKIIYIYI